ncbi:aspartate/glutamate racemase family protein [Novosphingobium sp.]|uniref:aspartate/glutamate racemase family protein n=1 Tax=Novosphingobium sp. TaxID=1874826 RepID=UPI00262A1ECD|nr:aspartate/glutamate racemase family protein [Novosphingobium sp.]
MRTLGLIGGLSWESTAEYYRLINQGVRDRVGPSASARLLLWSCNFAEIEALQMRGDWDGLATAMIEAAQRLEAAGAEGLLIASNTMHRTADRVETAIGVPLLHIADPAALAIRSQGLGTVGLLGTRFTMEQDFYRGRLAERHGLEVIVPDETDRETVHRVIYEELIAGVLREESRQAYRAAMRRMIDRGAEAVILGCTEIALLVGPDDCAVPLIDTTALHAAAAIEFALGA